MIFHALTGCACPNCRATALTFFQSYEGADLYKCTTCGKLTRHRFARTRCGVEGYNYVKAYRGHRVGPDEQRWRV